MTPAEYIAAVYASGAPRDVTWDVYAGSENNSAWVKLSEVSALTWSFAAGRVPTATIVSGDLGLQLATYSNFFKQIRIDVGFNGVNVRVFTGKVIDLNTNQGATTVQAQGQSWPLDVHFHKVIYTFAGVTAEQSLTDLFDLALITDFHVDMPVWSIGTVVVQTLEFSTYGEAIRKVAEVDGGEWYELPSGLIDVRQKYVLDMLTGSGAAREYFRGENGHLRSWTDTPSVKSVKNRCVVKGATQTTTNPDGSQESTDIGGSHDEPSPYVIYPDGSQAFNDELFTNELIDDPTKAAEVAERIVFYKNGLQHNIAAQVDGDPLLALFQNIQIEDTSRNYGVVGALMGYSGSIVGGDFSSSLTVLWIDNADGANIPPVAAFSRNGVNAVMDDRLYDIWTFDATASYSPSGRALTYAWSDNLAIFTGQTDPIVTVRVDDAAFVGPWEVTLDIDDGIDTNSVTIVVDPTKAWASQIAAALGAGGATVSGDGGQTYDDEATSVDALSVIAPNRKLSISGPDNSSLFTLADGSVAFNDVSIVSPDALVAVAFDATETMIAYVSDELGRVYRRLGGNGGPWRLHCDLRDVSSGSLLISKLRTFPGQRRVWAFGLDATGPFVAHFTIDDKPVRVNTASINADLVAAGNNPLVATVTDGASRSRGELAIIIKEDDSNNLYAYYFPSLPGSPEAWFRTNAINDNGTGWIGEDHEPGKFAAGLKDKLYTVDWDGATFTITLVGSTPGDHAQGGARLGVLAGGIAGAYVVAARGDGLLVTHDRFDTIALLRPASGYPTLPAASSAVDVATSITD